MTKTKGEKVALPAKNAEIAVQITPPKLEVVAIQIEGTAPYVQLRFSQKQKDTILKKMAAGEQAKKNTKREARDYERDYDQAMYLSDGGWRGMPASGFRAACISACRLAGFQMTRAKLSVFILADGLDEHDGTPLVRINGEPESYIAPVRNANGSVDLRVRAMWRKWTATVRVKYDAEQFSAADIANLMSRVGQQVGVGEGRADSKESCGCGFGFFQLVEG